MDARCKCGRIWNVSIKAKIPNGGYKCPICRSKEIRERENDKNGKVQVISR